MSKKNHRDRFGLTFDFPEEALTDPEVFEREVRRFRKRMGTMAKATCKGLHVERATRVGGGQDEGEDVLQTLGYEAPEGADSELPAEGDLRPCLILYTKTHCAFVEWGGMQASVQLRFKYSELRRAKLRPAVSRLAYYQLYRRM